jgi:hypothetical protein
MIAAILGFMPALNRRLNIAAKSVTEAKFFLQTRQKAGNL